MTPDPYADPNCDQEALDAAQAARSAALRDWFDRQPAPRSRRDVQRLVEKWRAREGDRRAQEEKRP